MGIFLIGFSGEATSGDVEWDFQVARPVRFRLRQMPGSHVDLNRWQDQRWHVHQCVTLCAHRHELFLTDPITHVDVLRALVCNSTDELHLAAIWLVVVAHVQQGIGRQTQYLVD